jgi:hypothetical protein
MATPDPDDALGHGNAIDHTRSDAFTNFITSEVSARNHSAERDENRPGEFHCTKLQSQTKIAITD